MLPDSGCVFQVNTGGFPDRMDMEYERVGKGESGCFYLSNFKQKAITNSNEGNCKKNRYRKSGDSPKFSFEYVN